MRKSTQGFTLIEILLVMVIISIVIYLMVGYVQQQALQNRIARTSAQMQQILNAALAFHVDNGKWPGPNGNLSGSTGPNGLLGRYLPNTAPVNSWGNPYFIYSYTVNSTNSRNFFVYTTIPAGTTGSTSAQAAANSIAGLLPLASATGSTASPPVTVTSCGTGNCTVIAQVNIPGQNLNNASAVNFAGIYHHGACVPVPSCPTDSTGSAIMTPQIMVVPVSVSGLKDDDKDNVYPISSFTAYAVGDSVGSTATPTTKDPIACTNSPDKVSCDSNKSLNNSAASAYWRVCLQVVTEAGDVQEDTRTDKWGAKVSLMAITRCASSKEASGTIFNGSNGSN